MLSVLVSELHQEKRILLILLLCTFFPLCTLLHLKVLKKNSPSAFKSYPSKPKYSLNIKYNQERKSRSKENNIVKGHFKNIKLRKEHKDDRK